MRKNSYGNMSERGAKTQAVLMSIYRTLKLHGHDPLKTITNAARNNSPPQSVDEKAPGLSTSSAAEGPIQRSGSDYIQQAEVRQESRQDSIHP